jgi:hypothetical protein
MQTPVGFKGRYFRLTAIAALSGALRSVAEAERIRAFRRRTATEREGERVEDPPPDEADLYTLVTHRFARKACHCNCIFRRKFRRLWHLYKFFFTPPRRYVKTKSGTSPPFFPR